MNNIVYTTKKTNVAYLIAGIVESLVYAGIGIYCLQLKEDMLSSWQFDYANTLGIASVFSFISAFINLLYKLMSSSTFADIYCDKIVGKGLRQLIATDFDLSFQQITDISYTGRFLNINTAAGKYKIVTNAKRAKEIFDHYNTIKNNMQ